MSTAEELVAELAEMLERARSLPLGTAVVDRAEMAAVLARLREELASSQPAPQPTDRGWLSRLARTRARRIVAAAERDADRRRRRADDYCSVQLARLEVAAARLLAQAQAARADLET